MVKKTTKTTRRAGKPARAKGVMKATRRKATGRKIVKAKKPRRTMRQKASSSSSAAI